MSRENSDDLFNEITELRQIRKALEKHIPSWFDRFKHLTPVALAVVGYFLSVQSGNFARLDVDIREMKGEISHHLQNSELHIPRSTVVSKDEFVIYQAMRDKQMTDLQSSLRRIEDALAVRIR